MHITFYPLFLVWSHGKRIIQAANVGLSECPTVSALPFFPNTGCSIDPTICVGTGIKNLNMKAMKEAKKNKLINKKNKREN